MLPDAAPAGADPLARADRAYQTAAAYFYATRYDEALRRFRAIAEDPASPWRPYGRYLAARALIRSATLPEKIAIEPLTAAETELRRVLDDPGASAVHASARGLLELIDTHARPVERLRAISAALAGGRAATDQQLLDYQWLMDRLLGDTTDYEYGAIGSRDAIVQSGDINDWMIAMQGAGTDAMDRAVSQWKRTRAVPWLVAALWKVPPSHTDAPALLTAAAAVERSSPAFPTVAFLRTRLLAARGEIARARALLATLPASAQPGFEPETVNLLAAERAALASSLDELLRAAPRTIVAEYIDGTSRPPSKRVPVFDDDAGVLFSQKLPLARLIETAAAPTLPERLRLRVAAAAFTRAPLLKRHDEALEAAHVLRSFAPSLRSDLARFVRATTPDDRHRAGLLIWLRTPGLQARVEGMDDDELLRLREPRRTFDHLFRRNWWCSFEPAGPERRVPKSELMTLVYPGGDIPSPSFLSQGERVAVERELAALAAIGTAPNYLAKEAVAWAVARPGDTDAAEALAHAVEGTRWGCRDDDTGAASRTAFQTLHRLFPQSVWAKRTRYWY